MSNPNAEQKLAIEHTGGVLLKAGAGSGKTFVLIEHITYLVNQWIEEHKLTGQRELFRSFLKSKFSKMVLMTFTKMAAGEISIRLFDKFNSQLENTQDQYYWQIAAELVDSISVSTIHGFCFSLIRKGFFKDIDAEDEMLSDIEFKLIIENLFDRWTKENNKESSFLIDLMIKDKGHLLSSLEQIIGDPTLRIMWQGLIQNGLDQEHEDRIWKTIFDEEGLNQIFDYHVDINELEGFTSNKWADFLISFRKLSSSKIESREQLKPYLKFFKSLDYKIPRSPTAKKVSEDIKLYYSKVKEIATFFKSNGEDFYYYITHYDEVISRWFNLFKELVSFVDIEYSRTPGLTFADLEYMVWQGLKDPEVVNHISESYNYFIVDEFQDTSYIQFEILETLIQKDFNRLFCVGDVKQAIYGFRGGELGVFMDCQKKVPKVLSLKNNYRSLSNIIHFNNNFFEYLFSKGLGFEGVDTHAVEVEYQNPPSLDMDRGKVFPLMVDFNNCLEQDKKLSNREIEYIEALRILEQIKEYREENNVNQTCVLYKRLRPAQQLIYLLLNEGIGFTAQIKVPYSNDPIIGIFHTLIQKRFDKNNNHFEFSSLLLKKYLELLGVEIELDFELLIFEFEAQEKYFGLYQAFLDFLARLRLSSSNYANNLDYISSMVNLAAGDSNRLLILMQDGSSDTYSMNFQSGENPQKVIIMTAHASKGLQFDNVILGGMYTNDARMPSSPLFGKIPMSLQWSLQLEGKKRFKTPQFIYEQILTKKKEFSESKRLFYVACTRAKKSLCWVEQTDFKMSKPQKGSWANGIFKWQYDKALDEVVVTTLEGKSVSNINYDESTLKKMENQAPLFHIDTLGNVAKLSENSQLMPIAELSVTRLASIADCPKKFYLKNICKISEEDLDILNSDKLDQYSYDDEEELTSSSFKSNARRGSLVHETLSQIITSDFSDMEIDTNIKNTVNKTVDKLKNYTENFEFISEKPIKFEIFGHMISGIPDLVLKPKDEYSLLEIWDFKTGSRKNESEQSYWFQLYCYAMSSYNLGIVLKDKEIKIVLYYVDTQQIVEKTVNHKVVENDLFKFWNLLKTPWVENLDHCDRCIYTNICQN